MGTQPYSSDDAEATARRRAHRKRAFAATVVFLVLFGLFVRAGIWQLDRADQKLALQAEFAAGASAATRRALVADKDASDTRFQRFELDGNYDPNRQILLDNMVSGGLNGYHVLTPFATDHGVVLINRGWLRADADRTRLPDINVGPERRTIVARLNTLAIPGIRLDAPTADADDVWPKRLLYPDQQNLSAALGYVVPDYQLLLDADQPDGYHRDWKAVETGPERNYGYAFQWFAFALLALVLFSIVNVRWNRQYRETELHRQLDKHSHD